MTVAGYTALLVGWLVLCANGPFLLLVACAGIAVWAGARP